MIHVVKRKKTPDNAGLDKVSKEVKAYVKKLGGKENKELKDDYDSIFADVTVFDYPLKGLTEAENKIKAKFPDSEIIYSGDGDGNVYDILDDGPYLEVRVKSEKNAPVETEAEKNGEQQ